MALDTYVGIAKHAGLRQGEAVLDALATLEGDPRSVADTLRAHHLIGLVRGSVAPAALAARVPHGLLEALGSRPSVQRVPPEVLLDAFDEVRRALAAAGVPVLMLKGLYFAERLYGGLGNRPQHDVDVLVRPRRRALQVVRGLGYEHRTRDLHSWSFGRGELRLDVHRVVRWAPAFRLDEDALWRDAIEVRVGGLAVPTLSDEHTLVALILTAFEDLGQGMAKLKQLLDLYLLLRQLDATLDWAAFLAQRRRENLLEVTVNVLALVVDLFEAREELVRLAAALDDHRSLAVLVERDQALALVAAPRKADASMEWFGRVYPGSLAHYLVWFWWGGFPANLGRLGPAWARSTLRVTRAAARNRGAAAAAGGRGVGRHPTRER